MVDLKQSINCNLQDSDVFFNLLDETDNEMKKMNEKIIVQKAEIFKTKSMMDLFEECFLKQNEMLTRLIEDKNILHEKKELLLASRDLDSDEDEKLVQTNCDDFEIDNCSDLITYRAFKTDLKRVKTIDCEYDDKRKKLSADFLSFNDSKISKNVQLKSDQELDIMTPLQTRQYIRLIEDRLICTEEERDRFQCSDEGLPVLRKLFKLQSRRFSTVSTKLANIKRRYFKLTNDPEFQSPTVKKTKLNKKRRAALRRRLILEQSTVNTATLNSPLTCESIATSNADLHASQ